MSGFGAWQLLHHPLYSLLITLLSHLLVAQYRVQRPMWIVHEHLQRSDYLNTNTKSSNLRVIDSAAGHVTCCKGRSSDDHSVAQKRHTCVRACWIMKYKTHAWKKPQINEESKWHGEQRWWDAFMQPALESNKVLQHVKTAHVHSFPT